GIGGPTLLRLRRHDDILWEDAALVLGARGEDHNGARNPGSRNGVEDAAEHRFAGHLVQDLRSARAHPAAHAGGHDDRGPIGHPLTSTALSARWNAGMTSCANRSSCSFHSWAGMPSAQWSMTCSSPGTALPSL